MYEHFRFRFRVKTQFGRHITKMTVLICLRIGSSNNGMRNTQGVSENLTKYEVLLKEHFAWSWLVGWFIVRYFNICQEAWYSFFCK